MNYDLSVDELVELVKQTKITYNPLDDLFKIIKLGDILYNVVKFKKWKVCTNLYDSILEILGDKMPEIDYSNTTLKELINIPREKNKLPSETKHTIIDYIRSIYISNSGFDYSCNSIDDIVKGRKYLDFMNLLRFNIDSVYKKYNAEWDEIDVKYGVLDDLIEEHFSDIELEEEYVNFSDKLMNLMNEVDILMKPFCKYTKEYVDSGSIDRDYELCFNAVMIKNNIDEGTKELIKSSMYITNLELHKLNINIKSTNSLLSECGQRI
jgi:hypothetical protein